jgi:hypothetical protein
MGRKTAFVGYVNGQEMVRAEEDSVPNGTIGLEVIGPRGNATEGRFDNLVVSEPGESPQRLGSSRTTWRSFDQIGVGRRMS